MIICKKCGNRNQDQDQFCASCGSFLEWSGERVVDPAQAPPAPPQSQPTPPPPAPSAPPPPPPAPPSGGGWVPPASVAAPSPVPRAPSPPAASQPAAPAQTPRPPAPQPAEALEARRPEAIPPTAQRPKPPPRTAPPAAETQESGIFCSRCGIGNDVRRHFCRRCGAPLAETVTPRVPWYRRLFPRRRSPVAGERHAPVRAATAGSLLRTFLLTMIVVLLVGGLLAYATVPNFRQAVNRQVDTGITQLRRQLGAGIVEVHPVGVRASSELSGHPARFAADLISNNYWAADTARDPQPTLVLTFDGPTDLDYLVITSGAAGDFARLARPRTVQLVYSDGTGEVLTLKDDPSPTTYNVHARGTTTVAVRVTSLYPVSGSTAVALAEVESYHLR